MTLFESLKKVNDKVYAESNGKTSVYVHGPLKGYFVVQIQEKDRAGWTLIFEKGFVVGIVNWQACGVCIYTTNPQLAGHLSKYRDLDMFTGQLESEFLVPATELVSLELKIKTLIPNFAINIGNFEVNWGTFGKA